MVLGCMAYLFPWEKQCNFIDFKTGCLTAYRIFLQQVPLVKKLYEINQFNDGTGISSLNPLNGEQKEQSRSLFNGRWNFPLIDTGHLFIKASGMRIGQDTETGNIQDPASFPYMVTHGPVGLSSTVQPVRGKPLWAH